METRIQNCGAIRDNKEIVTFDQFPDTFLSSEGVLIYSLLFPPIPGSWAPFWGRFGPFWRKNRNPKKSIFWRHLFFQKDHRAKSYPNYVLKISLCRLVHLGGARGPNKLTFFNHYKSLCKKIVQNGALAGPGRRKNV